MATAEQETKVVSQQPKPLWPNGQKLEIIGLTGEFASGKTLFGLTIAPAQTLVFDTEKSCGPYEQLGFTRVDLTKLSNLKPIELFEKWWAGIKQIPIGKYRVGMLDTVSEIESGLTDWVEQHPGEFGHTKGQYDKMEGLFWGDVKELWKRILSDLASRFETFVFTSHLRNVWEGGRPTGKRAPKGKETLMELASLYLHMERKPDEKGRVADKPSARVLKTRLAHTMIDDAGEVVIRSILPPYLHEATPTAIRKYIEQPADYAKLKKHELLPEERLSDDQRLAMQAGMAEANRDAEQAKLSRMELMRQAGLAQSAATLTVQRIESPAEPTTESAASALPEKPTAHEMLAQSFEGINGGANGEANHPPIAAVDPATIKVSLPQISMLTALQQELGMSNEQLAAAAARRGAATINDLTHDQAADMIEKMKAMREAQLKNSPTGRK